MRQDRYIKWKCEAYKIELKIRTRSRSRTRTQIKSSIMFSSLNLCTVNKIKIVRFWNASAAYLRSTTLRLNTNHGSTKLAWYAAEAHHKDMIRYNYSVSYASSDNFLIPSAIEFTFVKVLWSVLGRDGYNEVSQHFFPLLVSSKAYDNLQRTLRIWELVRCHISR